MSLHKVILQSIVKGIVSSSNLIVFSYFSFLGGKFLKLKKKMPQRIKKLATFFVSCDKKVHKDNYLNTHLPSISKNRTLWVFQKSLSYTFIISLKDNQFNESHHWFFWVVLGICMNEIISRYCLIIGFFSSISYFQVSFSCWM